MYGLMNNYCTHTFIMPTVTAQPCYISVPSKCHTHSKVHDQMSLALALHEQMEVGAGELLVDGVDEGVGICSVLCASPARLGRSGVLWGIGEGEGAAVDEAVHPEQGQGHGDGVPQPPPLSTEHGHIGNHAQHGLRGPVCNREKADRERLKYVTIWLCNSLELLVLDLVLNCLENNRK